MGEAYPLEDEYGELLKGSFQVTPVCKESTATGMFTEA